MAQQEQESNYRSYMEADVSQYIGEWVGIADGKIVAHGRNVKAVAEKAKAVSRGKTVLLARVPNAEAMIF